MTSEDSSHAMPYARPLSYARSATVSIVTLLMMSLLPVGDSVCHVHPLPGIDVSNIEFCHVCVPVRIQFNILHLLYLKPVLRHLIIIFFSFDFPPRSAYLLGKL